MSPLHIAARRGDAQRGPLMLRLLLEAGARPVALFASRGFTPLQEAVSKGHVAGAQLLLGAGADPTTRSRDQRRLTALLMAWMRRKQPKRVFLVVALCPSAYQTGRTQLVRLSAVISPSPV